jgi:hypothetical protein
MAKKEKKQPAAAYTANPPRSPAQPLLIASLVALVLIAAALGGGYLWGTIELKNAQIAWGEERDRLGAIVNESAGRIAALEAQQAAWKIDAGISEVIADLADKNYGLARDTALSLSPLYSKASGGMADAVRTALQPLAPLLDEIGRAADSMSPDALSKARLARDMIRKALVPAGIVPPMQ